MIGGPSVPIDRVLADLALISVEGDPWEPITTLRLLEEQGLDFTGLDNPALRASDVCWKVAGEDVAVVRWTAPLNVHDELLFHHFTVVVWIDGEALMRQYVIRSKETLPS